MSIQLDVGVPSADTIRTFRVPAGECRHEAVRYPQRLPRNPGQDVFCSDCGMERVRPKWMDRFTPDELRALQGFTEILAVWIDYTDPDPDRRITQRLAYQRISALLQVHRLDGKSKYIADILQRLEKYA